MNKFSKNNTQAIGVFDSGYGGLTVLRELVKALPQYDYLYLGDNARAPYGTRSFETVYEYTLQCVELLFAKGCHLVILACNTASAKALRNIQQLDLQRIAPNKRVLGVIRPTTEKIGFFTNNNAVGILATNGTVLSKSYPIEIQKFFPDIKVYQQACPLWVPLIENDEYLNDGADFFIKKSLDSLLVKSDEIDTLVLACTHYPLLRERIDFFLQEKNITILSQGEIVAASLQDYLLRHPEIEQQCSRHGQRYFLTTDNPQLFDQQATKFFGEKVQAEQVHL
jgi:glutamate racemase